MGDAIHVKISDSFFDAGVTLWFYPVARLIDLSISSLRISTVDGDYPMFSS